MATFVFAMFMFVSGAAFGYAAYWLLHDSRLFAAIRKLQQQAEEEEALAKLHSATAKAARGADADKVDG
jgi:hypothetical protein